jgi:hypothetical protein
VKIGHARFKEMRMRRRELLLGLAGSAGLAAVGLSRSAWAAAPSLPQVEVFKSPYCGCCGAWADHMKAAGFPVKVTLVQDTNAVRKRHGLPEKYGSCHTAVVAGYVLEGHVPAEDAKRLLVEKPAAIGLAVPGMPIGSPGMEQGDRKDAYTVLLVDKAGRASAFARHS